MSKENNESKYEENKNNEIISISYQSIFKISAILIIILISIMSFMQFDYAGASTNTIGSNSVTVPSNNVVSGDVQVVKMHVEGSQYVFEPSSVKLGTPIRLIADVANMPGCSKGVVSSELGIRKTFTSTDNTIEFTPTKAGTFYIACSMNMYKGSLTVLEADGSKSNYVQKPASGGMTCGSGGGGCGCGG